jgi:hypothetical protein
MRLLGFQRVLQTMKSKKHIVNTSFGLTPTKVGTLKSLRKSKVLTIFFRTLRRKRTLIGSERLMGLHREGSPEVSHLTYSLKCLVGAEEGILLDSRLGFLRDLVVL